MAFSDDPNETPVTTYEFFQKCIALFKPEYLQELFRRSRSQVYRWSENPETASNPSRNPLDRIQTLFRRLEEVERVDLAISALKSLADSIGMRVIPKIAPEPDQPTLQDEMLDDLPHLVRFHDAMKDGKTLGEVERLLEKAVHELHEDYEMYKRS